MQPIPGVLLSIMTQPKVVSTVSGLKISLTAVGTKPLSFQWYKDDTKLTDNQKYYEETTSSTLTIHAADTEQRGKFWCEVRDKHGDLVTSDKLTHPPSE